MSVEAGALAVLPATPDIAPVAAKLLYLSMQPLADYWMGVDDAQVAQRILTRLFTARQNLFSREFAEYARISGEPAGLELSYPGRMMRTLEIQTLVKFIAAAGVVNTIRMVRRSFPLQSIAEAAPDEYFLAHLAVLPEFEGRGLGRRLLERSVEKARASGARRITLTVDAGNIRAIGLYTRAGFSISSSTNLETLRRRFSYHGYHRMTKALQ